MYVCIYIYIYIYYLYISYIYIHICMYVHVIVCNVAQGPTTNKKNGVLSLGSFIYILKIRATNTYFIVWGMLVGGTYMHIFTTCIL